MSDDMTLPPGAFLGETVTNRGFAGFSIAEARYAPAARFARHDHELASLCLVRAGAYDENYGRQVGRFTPGTLVVHPAGDHHSNVHAPTEVRLLIIEFAARFLEELPAGVGFCRERAATADPALMALGARLEQETRRGDAVSALACQGLVLELIAGVVRAPEPRRAPVPGWVRRVEAALRDGGRAAASLAHLAALADVHPTYLARVFRQVHGCSIGDYKRHLMLEKARQRIESTTDPLMQIALDCEFTDQSHLTRSFGAAFGVSPGRYRQARRDDQAPAAARPTRTPRA